MAFCSSSASESSRNRPSSAWQARGTHPARKAGHRDRARRPDLRFPTRLPRVAWGLGFPAGEPGTPAPRQDPRAGTPRSLGRPRSFLVALVDHLGVDDLLLAGGLALGRRAVAGARRRLLLGRRVDLLRDFGHRRGQRLGLGVDLLFALGLERLADALDRALDLLPVLRLELLAQLLDLFLGLVGEALGQVARLRQLALLTVLVGVRLGVGDHALDLLLGEAGAGFDLDFLLFLGPQV